MPGLFRWPGVIPAGRVLDQPVSMMDVFPTIARVAGVPLPADRRIDGVDILPLLQGHTEVAPHEFMFHYCGNTLHATRYIPNAGTHFVLFNKGMFWNVLSNVLLQIRKHFNIKVLYSILFFVFKEGTFGSG